MGKTDNRQQMAKELTDIMLKRAGITKKDLLEVAIKRWVNKNMDLLTPSEKEKYKSILME
jgi:hypothetical protein